MVLSVLLETAYGEDPWWRRPPALRAMAYALFDRVDPELAHSLHAGDGSKRFTIGAMETRDSVQVRITTLDEASTRVLLEGVSDLPGGGPLAFGETSVRTLQYRVDAPPLAGITAYSDLARERFRTHVFLRFPTPTAFSQGDMVLPLPLPELMIRSWVRRWNEFSPPELHIRDEVVSALANKVGLARARIDTRTVDLYPGRLVGFTGSIALEALRPQAWSEGERSAFAAITAYSRFCGTGVRTTQGMGVTLPDDYRQDRRQGPAAGEG
jgi:CRISPR/Cas system endoribonuclease Cas6 (RAMP superfamily)